MTSQWSCTALNHCWHDVASFGQDGHLIKQWLPTNRPVSTWVLVFKYYLWQLNITGHISEALQRVMYYKVNLDLGILMGIFYRDKSFPSTIETRWWYVKKQWKWTVTECTPRRQFLTVHLGFGRGSKMNWKLWSNTEQKPEQKWKDQRAWKKIKK